MQLAHCCLVDYCLLLRCGERAACLLTCVSAAACWTCVLVYEPTLLDAVSTAVIVVLKAPLPIVSMGGCCLTPEIQPQHVVLLDRVPLA